eukprot:3519489-Karenia_brevis.AAC.1
MSAMLKEEGMKMFGPKKVDDAAIDEILSGVQPWNWQDVTPLEPIHFQRQIEHMLDSANGVDGIPYSAYQAC